MGVEMEEYTENEIYKLGFQHCQDVYEAKKCRTCAYAKTSGDFFVCDLGVSESRAWGNGWSFGCFKYKKSSKTFMDSDNA